MSELKPCQKCSQPYFPLRRGYCKRCDMSRRTRVGYQCSYVDATPARAHIAALRAAGVGLRQIAAATGISRSALQQIASGRNKRGSAHTRTTENVRDKVLTIPIPQAIEGVVGGALVDSIGTTRRLQALVAWGYPRSYLGRRLGWTGNDTSCSGNISTLMNPARLQVRAHTARRVEALFRELQMTPGPSVRARNEGRRKGWELPFDWDEDELDLFVVQDGVAS